MTEGTGKNIYQRLNAVLSEVEPMQKDGFNDAQKYAFISQATVVATLRPLLVKHGIMIVPTVTASETQPNASGKGVFNSVQMNFEIINIDDPSDRFGVPWSGEASDFSDKALNKSLTAGLKTFLMKLFLISDADPDAEQGEAPAQPVRTVQPATRYSNTQTNRYENTQVRQVTPSRPVPTFDPIPDDRPKVTKDDLLDRIKPLYDQWATLLPDATRLEDYAGVMQWDTSQLMDYGLRLKARIAYAELIAEMFSRTEATGLINDLANLSKDQLDSELKKLQLKRSASKALRTGSKP